MDRADVGMYFQSVVNDEEIFDRTAELAPWKEFFVDPLIGILERYRLENDPLVSFLDDVYLDVSRTPPLYGDARPKVSLDAYPEYQVELGPEHMLRGTEVLDTLSELGVRDEEVFHRVMILSLIFGEILAELEVRNEKKPRYEEVLSDIVDGINSKTFEWRDMEVSPYVSDEAVDRAVRGLKKIGVVRRKGNKIRLT